MLDETQRQARRGGVGGSDWYHLLNGCWRKVFYDKTLCYETDETLAMKRGSEMEDFVADKVARDQGLKLRRVKKTLAGGVLIGHPDREIVAHPRGSGVLEIKIPNPSTFREILDGEAKPYHTAQLMHYMGKMRKSWGRLAAFSPWHYKIAYVDIDFCRDAYSLLVETGERFWSFVQKNEPPERLDVNSGHCATCPYFLNCQGPHLDHILANPKEESDEAIGELVCRYVAVKKALKPLARRERELKQELRESVGDRAKVMTSAGDVYYCVEQRNAFDEQQFKKDYPVVWAQYVRPKTIRKLEVYA